MKFIAIHFHHMKNSSLNILLNNSFETNSPNQLNVVVWSYLCLSADQTGSYACHGNTYSYI